MLVVDVDHHVNLATVFKGVAGLIPRLAQVSAEVSPILGLTLADTVPLATPGACGRYVGDL